MTIALWRFCTRGSNNHCFLPSTEFSVSPTMGCVMQRVFEATLVISLTDVIGSTGCQTKAVINLTIKFPFIRQEQNPCPGDCSGIGNTFMDKCLQLCFFLLW